MKALLSIKPEYVEKIISGEKKFEYRKKIFKETVDSVVIYSTMPVGKIIGEFTINEIICDSPENIWLKTKKHSGVNKEFFNKYFENVKSGFALKIENLNIYETPLDPKKLYQDFIAPQSFRYIESNNYQQLSLI